MREAHSDDRWSFIKKQVFVFMGVCVFLTDAGLKQYEECQK